MPENMVGKLARCMYGTTAGDIWEACYADRLVNMVFTQSVASPFCFEDKMKVSVVVRGDFTALGNAGGLLKYEDLCMQNERSPRTRKGRPEGNANAKSDVEDN